MKMLRSVLLVSLLIFLFTSVVFTQNDTNCNYLRNQIDLLKKKFEKPPTIDLNNKKIDTRYGLFTSFNLNQHIPEFKQIDSLNYATCCPDYFSSKSQIGYDFTAGLLYEYPIIKNLALGLRLAYSGYSAILTMDEKFPFSYNGEEKEGVIQHSIDVNLVGIQFNPSLQYRLFNRLGISGGAYATYLMGGKFEQKEELTDTKGLPYTFNNGSKTRNQKSGTIPDMNPLQFGTMFSLSYEIPINKKGTQFIVPEISYSLALSDIAKDISWKVNQIRAGMAFKVSPHPTIDNLNLKEWEREKKNTEEDLLAALKRCEMESKPIALPPDFIRCSIDTILGVKKNIQSEIKSVDIERYVFSNLSQLLSYVFFDENTDAIPDRYNKIQSNERNAFSEDKIATNNYLEIYYDILNIVGRRLTENSNATITLIGHNSNTGIEKDNLSLSQKRADAIKYYLQNIWKIAEKRIKTEARNLPEIVTDNIETVGQEENRRVEILADNPIILAPVVANEQTFSSITPPSILVKLSAKSGIPINSWKFKLAAQELTVDLYEKNWQDLNNKKTILNESIRIDLQNLEDPDKLNEIDMPSEFTFDFKVHNAQTEYPSRREIKLNFNEISDYTISKYHLLMPFNQPGLLQQNDHIIDKINNEIQYKKTEIKVSGYTDFIGTQKANQELADRRANAVGKSIKASKISIQGEAEKELFDNKIPEGRFYNRCVIVEIKKKK